MKKAFPFFTIVILALASAGCGTSPATQPAAAAETPGIASLPTATVDIASAVNATLTALVTPPSLTPEATGTPLPTFTPGSTSTPNRPMISVTRATNCRTGPGMVYDLVGGLQPGETTEIVARDATGQYWFVRNPDAPGTSCWLWGRYATLVGDYASLPIFSPPPTPTLSPDFSVTFNAVDVCAGWFIEFHVVNTGGITWKSVQVTTTDLVTATMLIGLPSDQFDDWNGCATVLSQNDLMPGEVADINSGLTFAYNPTGNAMEARVRLCSQDGLAGTCLTRILNFTP